MTSTDTSTADAFLADAIAAQPDLGIYMATARPRIEKALRGPAARDTMRLLARLPDDDARAFLEAVAVRAYVLGDRSAAWLCLQLCKDNPPPKPKGTPEPDLEARVVAALDEHESNCAATLAVYAEVRKARGLLASARERAAGMLAEVPAGPPVRGELVRLERRTPERVSRLHATDWDGAP